MSPWLALNSRHSSCLGTASRVLGSLGEPTLPAGTAILSKLSVTEEYQGSYGWRIPQKAVLPAGPASGRLKGPEGSPACSRPARRTLLGLRHSPDCVCGRTSPHTGVRSQPATQQPFGCPRDGHRQHLVTSAIQTAHQWRERTAGSSLVPPPPGPPGRPRLAETPPTSRPAYV